MVVWMHRLLPKFHHKILRTLLVPSKSKMMQWERGAYHDSQWVEEEPCEEQCRLLPFQYHVLGKFDANSSSESGRCKSGRVPRNQRNCPVFSWLDMRILLSFVDMFFSTSWAFFVGFSFLLSHPRTAMLSYGLQLFSTSKFADARWYSLY